MKEQFYIVPGIKFEAKVHTKEEVERDLKKFREHNMKDKGKL